MAEGYKSNLIASLRGGNVNTGPRAGAGPQAINLSWGSPSSAPIKVRPRASGGALNPQRLMMQTVAPKDRQTFLAEQFARQANQWTPQSGYVNPVASLIDANKNRVEYVETANDVLNREQLMPSAPSPVASILPADEVDVRGSSYGSGGLVMPKGVTAEMASVAAYKPALEPTPDPVMEEPDVQAYVEQYMAPMIPTISAAPAELTEKAEPETAITVTEVPDVEPSTVRETLSALIPATSPELTQEPDPETEITIQEIPDAEPSTLRETLASLIPAAAVPADMPVPEPEPEGTVTVEQVPDVPVVSDGRPSGGYAIDTGLSRELMMLAALSDMVGTDDPQGQITIEELIDFV